jgi:predicted  nucleic acid-binding Zn-ribbon protein
MWRATAASSMKALRQLGFLKLPFRQEDAAEDDGRVLALFRNRAELKKAYGELQDEIYRLKDRIKQQEGATQRVQEMLSALEQRLGAQESGYPALVFYQLRGLWQLGRELIEQFVADLAKQLEERERRAHFAEHNRRQFVRRQTVDSQLRAAETELADVNERLNSLYTQRARLTRFWHYFQRRRLDQRIETAQSVTAAADIALAEARAASEELEKETAPEFSGMSVESRRAINTAAIAYAEVLCLRLVKTQLVSLAREATGRREVADDYGTRPECEALMAEIARARALIQVRTSIGQEVKVRAERLKQIARYRGANDTSPTPESIAFSEGDVLAGETLGASAARMPNVLAEDTWDLFRVLLR